MAENRIDFGPITEEEVGRYAALLDHAFADSPSATPDQTWIRQQGLDTFRVVHVGGQVAAGMGMLPMGQWFGGRSVPTTGIVGVVVAPEHRGSGVASGMMRAALAEMRAAGAAISTLYPSTQPVYRRVGYEQAGFSVRYRIPLHALPAGEKSLTLRAVEPADESTLHRLYAEQARLSNGNLDRPPRLLGVAPARESGRQRLPGRA